MAVTQTVHGALGWSQSPCQSTTSAQWYFANGSSAASNLLYVSLLNPTSTPVVVDLGFLTPSGMVHPINYQGIVLPAGQVAVENVSSEVQNVPTISTVVATRTGRVVASEVQELVDAGGTSGGLSLVPGAPAPQPHWTIPQAQEVPGGSSEVDIFNPGRRQRDGDGGLPAALGPAVTRSPTRSCPGRPGRSPPAPRRASPTTRPMPPPSTPPEERASWWRAP